MYKVHANDIYHRQCKYGVHVCQSVLECWIGEFEKLSLKYLCLKLVNFGSVRLAHGSKKFLLNYQWKLLKAADEIIKNKLLKRPSILYSQI